jgi:hypothetical protein
MHRTVVPYEQRKPATLLNFLLSGAFIMSIFQRLHEYSGPHRQQHAAPIMDKLRNWLDGSLPTVPPGTLTGKALNCLHNEWPKLVRYLEDGRLEIDNNLAENAIRPFVIGRNYPHPIIMQGLLG